MELSERKRAILAAVVKYHIATGEPVGSKWLASVLENAPSSATLRNEMSDLCSLGYLEQPHTSAGRIPTGKGYEFYVSKLMTKDELSDSVKETIDSMLLNQADTEALPLVAAKILSRILGLTSFSAKIADEGVIIRRIEILPMSPHLLMMVAITADGRTSSRLCKSNASLTGVLADFEKIIKADIEGKPLYSLTTGQMQNISVKAGIDALEIMPIMATLFDMIKDMGGSKINTAGETYLYTMFSSPARARQLLSFIERKEGILSLISSRSDEVGIIFGNDTNYAELNSTAVIVAPYGDKDNPLGRIGVIGSTRLSYGQIVPIVSYIAQSLSKIISENLKLVE